MSLVDTGPPSTSPVGSGSEWPGECHGSRSVLSERRVRTYRSARPWVPWCGYSVLTSAECILNLSIAAPADKGPVRVGHTVSQQY